MSESEKDRHRTEKSLLTALGDILIEQGSDAVGVNAVARRAGVSKVLLYRYFGDLNGLIQAWVHQASAVDPQELSTKLQVDGDIASLVSAYFGQMVDRLAKDAHLRALMRWELSNKSQLTDAIAQSREAEGLALTKLLAERLGAVPADTSAKPSPRPVPAPDAPASTSETLDLEAVAALLTGGIYYLLLRSDTAAVFNGLGLGDETGRQRLKDTINKLVKALIPVN